MSLQVWLPLNGDLHNQGLNNITVTNNGATVNNNGKIGKCYQFSTAASDILIPATAMTSFTTECSICFWIKILSWNTSYATFFQAGTSSAAWTAYIFGLLRNNANSNCCFTISNGSSASNASYLTPTLELNTWYHLGLIYKTGHCLIYINGQLYQDYTTSIVPKFNGINVIRIGRCANGSSYQTNCLLNDFRIYDHALLAAEIEEISKGLILHYQLNNNGLGNPNLVPCGGTYTEVSPWTTTFNKVDGNKWVTNSAFEGIPGKTYTISVRCDGTLASAHAQSTSPSVKSWSFWLYVCNSDTTKSWQTGAYDSPINLTNANHNYRKIGDTHVWTYTLSSTQKYMSLRTNSYSNGTDNVTIKWWNMKIEEGDTFTVWTPYIAEQSNIVYDSSGYNNNGEVINGISVEPPSPKYNIATHISATNQKIKISGLTTTGFSSTYSFAWWEKISTLSAMHWGFSDGVRLNGMYTGHLWNTGDSSQNPLYNPGTTTQVTDPTINVWHHWVMTGDGTKCRVYQDGELWAEAKTFKTITGTTIYINGWDSGTSYSSNNASISDFRIYTTTLTAAQVKELYRTSMIVDGTAVRPRDLE